MSNIRYTSLYSVLGLAIALVGCSGNDSTTTIGATVKIDLDTVDKAIETEAWTVENYKTIGALGYTSLVDNINIRSALLGREKELGIFLNLFSINQPTTIACDFGSMTINQEDANTRVKFEDCQLGEIRYEGETWTDLAIACDPEIDNVVTDTFTMGYKDYTQRQKLNESTSFSQLYANGEYKFVSRSQLNLDEITDNNLCPKLAGIDSKVTLSSQTFVQIEEDDSETTITNVSHEFQPDSPYVEYQDLELFEGVADSSVYSIVGFINMNILGNNIEFVGSNFEYGLDGKAKTGLLRFIKGDSEVSLVFSPDSVEISLDLDTTDSTVDSNEIIDQDDF
jgi:hypothetical protein